MWTYDPGFPFWQWTLPVMEQRPYAPENLIIRDVELNQETWKFVIDPGTQRWIITKPLEVKILELSDGKKTINEIAASLMESEPSMNSFPQFLNIIQPLFYKGFLFDNLEEHQHQSTRIYNDTPIRAIHLEITNICNLRCSHCYLSSGVRKPNELSLKEIKDIVDYFPPGTGSRICITGGEPLLHKDIYEILEYSAVVRGLMVDLYSNAILIDDEIAEKLKDIIDRSQYGVNFQISLEGSDPVQNDAVRGEGVFDKVMKNIEILATHGLNKRINLFICITKQNIHQIPEMIEMAENLDVHLLKFSQWQKQGRAEGVDREELAPSLEEWVNAGKIVLNYPNQKIYLTGNFFADLKNTNGMFYLTSPLFPKFGCHLKIAPRIDCEGNVWPCQLFVDPAFIVGNIREEPLENIFSGGKYQNLFSACVQRVEKTPECAPCEWKELCGCGCPAFAHTEYGELNHQDFFCDVRKYWFEEYMRSKIQYLTGMGV